jgi:hypothetical protein
MAAGARTKAFDTSIFCFSMNCHRQGGLEAQDKIELPNLLKKSAFDC